MTNSKNAPMPGLVNAEEAMQRLIEGNQRFARGERRLDDLLDSAQRDKLLQGQQPFAVVLGCSDSRVPVEMVFDHGMGDLFVIRVAGNIVARSQIGSVEFAATQFGTRLIVVLGHSQCGAIEATLDALRNPGTQHSHNLSSIVDRIRPSVEELLSTNLVDDPESLSRHAVRANVRVAANDLRHGSDIIEKLIAEEGLRVVGAEYSIATGEVEFFEG